MSACRICTFVQQYEDGQDKERLLALFESSKNVSAVKIQEVLAEMGLHLGLTGIREHRRKEYGPSTYNKEGESRKTPDGWAPFTEFTDKVGSAIVRLPTPKATARDLLITGGFNPDEWQISGSINTRRWMRYDQEWLYYYKFDVVAGESPEVVQEHVDELVKHIRSRKRTKTPRVVTEGSDGFVFAASDWQIGKAEGADGTPQTVQRVNKSIDMAGDRIQKLRRIGHIMPEFLFAGLGDLGEGTCGFYPGQQFLIDRNRREQGRINRELITSALNHLTPMFDRTIVAAVGGNHGENRSPDGRRITSDGDNDDCAYFDAIREAFDRSGSDIDWRIMEDELSMSLHVGGVKLGLTHGHLFQGSSGSMAQKRAYEWWKGQDFGFHAVRDTRILLSAHFHHFSAISYGSRTHLQTPPMDPGSKWFRETRGEDSPPGTLTFRLDADVPLGWDDLMILQP